MFPPPHRGPPPPSIMTSMFREKIIHGPTLMTSTQGFHTYSCVCWPLILNEASQPTMRKPRHILSSSREHSKNACALAEGLRVCVGSNRLKPSLPTRPPPPWFLGLRFACGGGFVSGFFQGGLGHIQPRSPNFRGNRA